MGEFVTYFLTIAFFSFVIAASAWMRHEMLLLACMPPVFVASIVGFVMALYAGETWGYTTTILAALVAVPPAWWLARRFSPRDLLLTIYLMWAAALVLALTAFAFPDRI